MGAQRGGALDRCGVPAGERVDDGRLVQREAGARVQRGQATRERARRQDARRARVVERVGKPVVGVIGLERQVGAAGAQNRQQRDDEVDRARERDADRLLGTDAAGHQQPREPARARVELRPGQRVVLADDGYRVRPAEHDLVEQGRQRVAALRELAASRPRR